MAWTEQYGPHRLPPTKQWQQLRQQTAERAGYQCEATMRDGTRCTALGTECDHKTDRNNHSLENLQWLCSWHHAMKTKREAQAGLRAARARNMPKPKKHPGLI